MTPATWRERLVLELGARTLAPSPGELVGIEQEYVVRAPLCALDFRRILHTRSVDGRRLDPGDSNAYRCRSGAVLTCDDAEAELASPPIRCRPGFTAEIAAWASGFRHQLDELLPNGVDSAGHSTHISVSMTARRNDAVLKLFARTFAPSLILLMERPTSYGMWLRPRPSRSEFCGEFVEGAPLRAATALAAGGAIACAQALATGDVGLIPPLVRVRLRLARERYGWYLDRDAYGTSLHGDGRRASLTGVAGGRIDARTHLAAAWSCARRALGPAIAHDDDDVLTAYIDGSLRLPAEGGAPDAGAPRAGVFAAPEATSFGDVLTVRTRPQYTARAIVATWDVTVLRLDGRRTGFLAIPRAYLGDLLVALDAGRLDGILSAFLASSPAGRVLRRRDQLLAPDLFDGLDDPRLLLPIERDPVDLAVAELPSGPGWQQPPARRPASAPPPPAVAPPTRTRSPGGPTSTPPARTKRPTWTPGGSIDRGTGGGGLLETGPPPRLGPFDGGSDGGLQQLGPPPAQGPTVVPPPPATSTGRGLWKPIAALIGVVAVGVTAVAIAVGRGGGTSTSSSTSPSAASTTAAPAQSAPASVPTATATAAQNTITVAPMTVRFVQAEFATHYAVTASDTAGRSLTYAWTLIPPAVDPPCNNRGDVRGAGPEFVWHHGDQDGCNHTVSGPLGHQGTVTVVVSDGVWSCQASYTGTEGVGGNPDATVAFAPCTYTGSAP